MSKSTEDFFDRVAAGLREEAYRSPHAMNAVRLRITLDLLAKYTPGKILDVGCGGGHTTATLLEKGWDAEGIDFAAKIVNEARAHLASRGFPPERVVQAGAEDLSRFPDAHFDGVLCLGVLYYIEDDDRAYREIHRVLKPGGFLIATQQNELFDLFTFNRYTLRFFRRHFFPLIAGGEDERAAELEELVRGLMTRPDAPRKHAPGSGRDVLTTRPENPLTYPQKISSYGFTVIGDPYFHGIHLLPPLALDRAADLKNESERRQYDLRQDWRAMFMASQFLVECRRDG